MIVLKLFSIMVGVFFSPILMLDNLLLIISKSWLGLRIFFVWRKCMDIVKKYLHVFPSGFQAGKFLHLLLSEQMALETMVLGGLL